VAYCLGVADSDVRALSIEHSVLSVKEVSSERVMGRNKSESEVEQYHPGRSVGGRTLVFILLTILFNDWEVPAVDPKTNHIRFEYLVPRDD